ncbi:hypothetical protein BH11ACT4_BH11ACT4_10680 [soil metagenome]
MTAAPAAARRPRRQRSVSESLLSIVLGLEAVLVFFVALTAFGLKALPPAAALGGGAGLIVALVLVAGLLRFTWAVWLGWALQAVLLATGVFLPVMFVVAAVFLGIWIFCFVKGRQLDTAKSQYLKENP